MHRPNCLVLLLLVRVGLFAAQDNQLPDGTVIDTLARGLDNPWGVVFLGNQQLLINERPGVIYRVDSTSHRRIWARLPVQPHGAGLLGMTRDLATDSIVIFVAGSFPSTDRLDAAENRVYRLEDSAGVGVIRGLIVTDLPTARAHAGSAMAFGPDDKLYVTLGDGFAPTRAQDPGSAGGKLLRFNRDGSIPADNPTPNSPVSAGGLRNEQGLAWHPEDGSLFLSEHGPSNWPWENGRAGDDELNVVVPNGNYGWPLHTGAVGITGFLDPIRTWTPAIAPSGIHIYTGPYLPWRHHLLVAALRGRQLLRIELERTGAGWRILRESVLLADTQYGRFRGVFQGSQGHLYLTTSNRRDSQGVPDDLVLRIRLPATPQLAR